MIWAILAVFTLYIIITSLAMLEMKRLHDDEAKWLRERIVELEADKRALTESICRSEGKVFIPPSNTRPVEPAGDGWWDARPEIIVTELPRR